MSSRLRNLWSQQTLGTFLALWVIICSLSCLVYFKTYCSVLFHLKGFFGLISDFSGVSIPFFNDILDVLNELIILQSMFTVHYEYYFGRFGAGLGLIFPHLVLRVKSFDAILEISSGVVDCSIVQLIVDIPYGNRFLDKKTTSVTSQPIIANFIYTFVEKIHFIIFCI